MTSSRWWGPGWEEGYVDDGDGSLEGFGRVEGAILLEDIHKGMLPFRDVLHRRLVKDKFKL